MGENQQNRMQTAVNQGETGNEPRENDELGTTGEGQYKDHELG